jgi:hypothetical protein
MLPRGERPSVACGIKRIMLVSIHAPARGATFLPCPHSLVQERFNPRSRAGSDFDDYKARLEYEMFQSTLPRGERQHSWEALICKASTAFFREPLIYLMKPDEF